MIGNNTSMTDLNRLIFNEIIRHANVRGWKNSEVNELTDDIEREVISHYKGVISKVRKDDNHRSQVAHEEKLEENEKAVEELNRQIDQLKTRNKTQHEALLSKDREIKRQKGKADSAVVERMEDEIQYLRKLLLLNAFPGRK